MLYFVARRGVPLGACLYPGLRGHTGTVPARQLTTDTQNHSAGPYGPVDGHNRALLFTEPEMLASIDQAQIVLEGEPEALAAAVRRVRTIMTGTPDAVYWFSAFAKEISSGVDGLRGVAAAFLTGDAVTVIVAGQAGIYRQNGPEVVPVVTGPAYHTETLDARAGQSLYLVASAGSIDEAPIALRSSLGGTGAAAAPTAAQAVAMRNGATSTVALMDVRAPATRAAGRRLSYLVGALIVAAASIVLILIFVAPRVARSHASTADPVATATATPTVAATSVATTVATIGGLNTASVSPSGATLAWNGPASATRYTVIFDSQKYRTHATHLRLNRSLSPGKSYHWQVRARFGAGPTVKSPIATVTVPLLAGKAVSGLHPSGVVQLNRSKTVSLCWRQAGPGAVYDLYLITGAKHLHQQPARLAPHAPHGMACTTQDVKPGSYAWQVGAVVPGHKEGWSAWTHFTARVAKKGATRPPPVYVAPTLTPVPAAPTAAPVAPVVNTPVPVVNTPVPVVNTPVPIVRAPTPVPVAPQPAPTTAPTSSVVEPCTTLPCP